MVSESCWDINPGCGTGSCPDHCPALQGNKPCWEFDWVGMLSEMERSERNFWRNWVKERCINCPVYEQYPGEVESFLDEIHSFL
ncbi:MAG: hypothetical protein ABH851_01320 [Methanobacteriota archaeon]